MAFSVNITARAERDLAALYAEIDAVESLAARKWYLGLRQAILSLEELPERAPVIRSPGGIRQLLYGKKHHVYLILFRIRMRQQQVDVLHIRHGARLPFSSSNVKYPLT